MSMQKKAPEAALDGTEGSAEGNVGIKDTSANVSNQLAIRFSRGETKHDNLPAQREAADFDDFADAVLGDRAAAKGLAYVCAPLGEGFHNHPDMYPGVAAWRLKKLAQPRCFLPLDLDGFDSPETFTRLLAWLERFQGFAYTTASSTPDAPRCRVVLAQSRATDQGEGKALGEAVQAMIEAELGAGMKFDQSVYGAAQPLYTPLLEAETFRFSGVPVDVDAMLAQSPPKKPQTNGSRLELVKGEDLILNTLNVLGMVRAEKGGGAYYIQCPFEDQHTSFTGDGETIYYLAHTNGFAMAHFKCLHAHCAKRTDTDFKLELIRKYQKQMGKLPAWGVQADIAEQPEQPDTELEWILANAPATIQAYVEWHMENAFRPHPVFALASALLFIQAFIGRSVRLPRDLRVNLGQLVFAPTESGKNAVIDLAENAIAQLSDKKVFAAVLHFASRFASHQAMLWKLSDNPQVVWANAEMVKTLLDLMAAKEGTPQYTMCTVLMDLYDAATRRHMEPINYTGHDTRSKKMPPLSYPFFAVVGLGVTNAIGRFNDAAAEDGLLNRFLCWVVEDLPPMGSGQPETPLPAVVVKWAQGLQAKKFVEFLDPNTPPPAAALQREAKVLALYPAFDADWRREGEYGAQRAQTAPGVWGRYAQKILQVAMLYAVADSMRVTPEGFEWAKRLVHWNVSRFGQQFDGQGGGAQDVVGKVRNAFLACFEKPAAVAEHKKHGHLSSGYIARQCRAWKDNPTVRPIVVKALQDEGIIQEIKIESGGGGVGYRLLQV